MADTTKRTERATARYRQIYLDDQEITQAKILVARGKLWTGDIEKLLRRWRSQIIIRQKGHSISARRHLICFYIIGIVSTILAAMVAIGSLTTFRNCDAKSRTSQCRADEWIRLAAAIIAIFSSIASGISLLFNWSGSAEKHKSAANTYEDLIRNIDSTLKLPVTLRGDALAYLQNTRGAYNDTMRSGPPLGAKYDIDLEYRCLTDETARNCDTAAKDILSPRSERNGKSSLRKIPRKASMKTSVRMAPIRPSKIIENTNENTEPQTYPVDMDRWHRLAETLTEQVINVEHQEALAIEEANDYDSEDERNKDREVVVSFDLDSMPPTDPIEIRRQQIRKSIMSALAFEMGRLSEHSKENGNSSNGSPYSGSSIFQSSSGAFYTHVNGISVTDPTNEIREEVKDPTNGNKDPTNGIKVRGEGPDGETRGNDNIHSDETNVDVKSESTDRDKTTVRINDPIYI